MICENSVSAGKIPFGNPLFFQVSISSQIRVSFARELPAYSSAFSHYYSWKKWFQYYSGRIKSPPSLFQKDKMLKQTKCSFSSEWMELDSIHMSFSAKENDSIPHSKPAIFLEITYKTNALNWQIFSIRFTKGTMLFFSTVFGIIYMFFADFFDKIWYFRRCFAIFAPFWQLINLTILTFLSTNCSTKLILFCAKCSSDSKCLG